LSLERRGKLSRILPSKHPLLTATAFYSGIGLETSILFASEGANVLLTDISEDALAAAVTKVKEFVIDPAQKIEGVKVDVSKEEQVKNAIEALDGWGGVDVVFNNAGIMHADVSLREFIGPEQAIQWGSE
jgi:NAD(P)-dependent dehydrogenase (short-subunit alcohol dehydrogenase family)